jgi:hypothetical protein
MDYPLVLLLLLGFFLWLFAEAFIEAILRWLGIAVVWLLTFGTVDLRVGKRAGDSWLAVGCGVFFCVALGAVWKYAVRSP